MQRLQITSIRGRARRSLPRLAHLLVLLLAASQLSCSLATSTKNLFGGKLDLRFVLAPDANESSPVAVELVMAYEKKVVDELKALSAEAWFENREQFVLDHPDESSYAIYRWEWVPGQRENRTIEFRPRARAAVLFARYFSAGQHRAVLDPRKRLEVRFGAKSFQVVTPEKKKRRRGSE